MSVKDCQSIINNMKIKLDDAQRDYNNIKALYESGAIEKEKVNEAESALKTAQSDYDKSVVDLEAVQLLQ